jgi:YD repeat-containing protein
MTTESTCPFCEKWVATSWKQYINRQYNLTLVAGAEVCPCPQCRGTYWAMKKPPPEQESTEMTVVVKVVAWIAAAIILASLFVLLMPHAGAETFRDASGRLLGTSNRDSNGTTTFRDASGRQTGTATTNSNGTTTFRDASGRMTGTAERRR